MLRIRLSRVGKKKQPYFRVVVADIEAKRDGRIVERIGNYNPLTEPRSYEIDEGRALYWLSMGAQPTNAVKQLLKQQGTLGRLNRLHEGESLETLVAEYQGEAAEAAEAAPDARAVAEAEEAVAATAVMEEE
ncbi:MAG: 30S ribosomal protein S16 [Chloroflexota bacterium]